MNSISSAARWAGRVQPLFAATHTTARTTQLR
jgi:hypothetical protein